MSKNINIENLTNTKISAKKCKEKVLFFGKEKDYIIASMEITFVDDKKMEEINNKFLNHEGTTDIITFNYDESEEDDVLDFLEDEILDVKNTKKKNQKYIHGELFICVDQAKRQAKQYQVLLENELTRLIFHGLLHIIGIDDLTEEERAEMRLNENILLDKWYS